MKKYRNLAGSIAGLLLLAALPQVAQAASYYWDADGTTAGFGTPNGTDIWGTNADWTTDVTGVATPTAYTTTTSDDLNFGFTTTGLAAGTVLVTGTQNAGTLTFASGSGAIVLSGGTAIDLAAVSKITVNNAADTITTPLTGAGTSLTKLGTGTLTLNGANTYTGTTIIKNGALQIGDDTTGSLVGTNPLTFSGTGTFNVQEADTVNQGMGTLSFNAGQGKVQNTFNATDSTLTFSGMNARSAGATANFTTSGGTNGTDNKIVLSSTTNAPMSNSGSNNPGIFFGLDSLSTAVSFARYDATGGFFRATNYPGDSNATATAGSYGSAVDLSIVSTTSTGGSVSLNTLRAVPTANSQRFDVGNGNTLSINGILAVVPSAGVQFRIGTGTPDQGFLQPTTDGGEVVFAVARGNSSALTTSSLAVGNIIQNFSGGSAGTKVTTESNATMVFQASNTYTGVTTINSGLLRILKWADAGSASGLGKGSTGTTPNAADIVINGGTLNYGNVTAGTPARTNRIFTIGPAGATLDNSSNTVNTTNTWAIGQNSDGSSSGSIAFSDSNAPASLTLTHNAPAATQFGTGTLGAVLGDPGTGANVTSLTKSGTGTWILSAANTYTGNTTVNAGTLTLGSTGTLKFVPTANGVCNKITGAGTATLNGTFNIDLTNAAIANGNSWTLVDTTVKNGTLIAVTGFTGSSGVWTKVDGGNTWTYTESTGVLGLVTGGSSYTLTYSAGANGSITGTSPQSVASGGNGTAVTAVPNANYHFVNWSDSSTANPRTDSNVTANISVTANFAIDTYTDWALANSVAGGVNGDSNNDGVQNGVAYFMGVTGQTTNPGLNASNQVTWPVNPNYQGTFEVQISSDLITWTPASPQPTPSAGNLTYTLPSGLGKQFVRLVVTPN
jgi:autotransporter-associated beta strand protein